MTERSAGLLVQGTGLSKLQHQIELHEESWDLDPPPGASPAEMHNTVKELLEAFGHMIFDIGAPGIPRTCDATHSSSRG